MFDPKGGYFKKGGKYMPSIVAEIGDVIETHLKTIGLIKDELPDKHRQALINEKRAEYESRLAAETDTGAEAGATEAGHDYPQGASLCAKCQTKAVVLMDGCTTCLNCGESKCG